MAIFNAINRRIIVSHFCPKFETNESRRVRLERSDISSRLSPIGGRPEEQDRHGIACTRLADQVRSRSTDPHKETRFMALRRFTSRKKPPHRRRMMTGRLRLPWLVHGKSTAVLDRHSRAWLSKKSVIERPRYQRQPSRFDAEKKN